MSWPCDAQVHDVLDTKAPFFGGIPTLNIIEKEWFLTEQKNSTHQSIIILYIIL